MTTGPLSTWLAQRKKEGFHPSWIIAVVVITLLVGAVVWYVASLASKAGRAAHGQPGSRILASAAPLALPSPAAGVDRGGGSGGGSGGGAGHGGAVAVNAGFAPPDPDDIPPGEFGDAVRLGRDIFTNTQTYARAYVGNGLNCVNCHLDAGRKADSAPLWGAYPMFPTYRDKNHKVNTYEDRLSGCFRFSMNGKAPAYGSKELVALESYSYWLSRGAPIGKELPGRGYPKLPEPAQTPDAARGKLVFDANCAICHGSDGQGTQVAGRYAFPPLWGPQSFNGGAGMSQIKNASAFIHANMPLGKGGTLSAQQAWDVAQYMDSQTRPPDPRKAGS